MDRLLPTYDIEGTRFTVDVAQGALIESGRPSNVILFGDMQDFGTHYTMCYNKQWKNFPCEMDPIENAIDVTIPQMAALDPEGMALKYGLAVDAVKGMNDTDIMIDQQWLGHRQQGNLPTIDIAGDRFTVDLTNRQLFLSTDATVTIGMQQLHRSEDYQLYTCFYHQPTKQAVTVDLKATELPKDVVMLKLPVDRVLDPYAAARESGMDPKRFLREFPPQRELKAVVVPLHMTGLPDLIERNRQAAKPTMAKQQRNPQQQKAIRPRNMNQQKH